MTDQFIYVSVLFSVVLALALTHLLAGIAPSAGTVKKGLAASIGQGFGQATRDVTAGSKRIMNPTATPPVGVAATAAPRRAPNGCGAHRIKT